MAPMPIRPVTLLPLAAITRKESMPTKLLLLDTLKVTGEPSLSMSLTVWVRVAPATAEPFR